MQNIKIMGGGRKAWMAISATVCLTLVCSLAPNLVLARSYAWQGKSASPAVALPAAGSFALCADQFPLRTPLDIGSVDRKWAPAALCSNQFAVLYSKTSKTPLLVVERLNRTRIEKGNGLERSNEFFEDPRLGHQDRASLEDFKGSGYDRGHMSSARDQSDELAMDQSFALSNMVPQDPFNNQRTWNKIESDVRKYAMRAQGDVFVFSGPQFLDPNTKTIGRGRVWVPTHLFKLVYDASSGRSWAYRVENNAQARVTAPMDYASFVQLTGWNVLPKR